MTKDEFYNEYNYQEIKRILKMLFFEKLISKVEFQSMLSIMKAKYNPIFDMITE